MHITRMFVVCVVHVRVLIELREDGLDIFDTGNYKIANVVSFVKFDLNIIN